MKLIRILFLADTHLGFDLPIKPKIKRRRRGVDFFKNYHTALKPALNRDVDLLIHGGDLFYRSKIPEILIDMAFAPLLEIADSGIPVVLVPGNHERSVIKQSLFLLHKNIHIFDSPKYYNFKIKGCNLNIGGFPCVRKNIRNDFKSIIKQITPDNEKKAEINILCMHQAVEGAQVGTQDYTFRKNHDTIKTFEIPKGFASVLSGQIHRHQVITKDLSGKSLPCPVFYPGAIERTSFAERLEEKGYLLLNFAPDKQGGKMVEYHFKKLLCRPMRCIELNIDNYSIEKVLNRIKTQCENIDVNSVIRIKLNLKNTSTTSAIPKIEQIRKILPKFMNLSLRVDFSK